VEQPPEEAELREWFELNRDRYDVPELYTIERLRLPDVDRLAEAEALAARVDEQTLPEDQRPFLQEFRRRTAENLAAFLSPKNTEELLGLPTGQWMAVEVSGKPSLVRVSTVHAAVPAQFENAKYEVAKDFKKAASGLQVTEMATDIANKYRIHMEFDESDLERALADARDYDSPEVTAQSRSLKARAGVSGAEEG